MRIIIVNSVDTQGGAARAANRLHHALLSQGIESQMLVQQKKSDDFTIFTLSHKYIAKIRPWIDALITKLYPHRCKSPFSPSWLGLSGISKQINALNPDIVHLHWIAHGMISAKEIAKINAPIVWSLHDMWAFTGGCHYDNFCGKYKYGCGSCPILKSNHKYDLSRFVFNRKKHAFQKKKMTIIGLSHWLYNTAKESPLLSEHNHICLPNTLDTQLFKPFNQEQAKTLWSLPKEKKLLLFGAMGATSDLRKGFILLKQALESLDSSMFELVILGASRPKLDQLLGFKTHYMGQLNDEISLVTLYNAVHVVVVPSIQENLSNAIMESLSCGTPVVAFNIGGNSDMIEHKINGYLAIPYDPLDLAEGINWVLNYPAYDSLCLNSRFKALCTYDSQYVALQYIKLYHSIIAESSNTP